MTRAAALLLSLCSCTAALPPAQAEAPAQKGEASGPALPRAAETPTIDPAAVETLATTCPEVDSDGSSLRFGGDDRPLECSRPGNCRPHRALVGASLPELWAFAGPPTACRGGTYTYDFDRDCKQERDRLILRISGDEVVSARHEHLFEGEGCAAAAD